MLSDGLYQVTTDHFCAGFVIENGVVVHCAPILRNKIKYWFTKAIKVQTEFRVIIFGGRYFNNYFLCKQKVKNILANKIAAGVKIIVVSGACNTGYVTYNRPDGTAVCGGDGCGEKLAAEMGWQVEYYPADWINLGKPAGPIRNRDMGKIGDAGIGFWDEISPGTKDMIDVLQEIEKKPCRVITFVAESSGKKKKAV